MTAAMPALTATLIARNAVGAKGLMRAALLSPLVPPVLVCVGIFSYTMLDILAGDAGMGSRRAIDLGLFLGTLVLVYGFVFSYASMFVFFIPCHIGLRILGVGGYFPYCLAGALSTALFLVFGMTDPAIRGGNMDAFYVLCGAIAGVVFWRLAAGAVDDRAPHPWLRKFFRHDDG